VHDDAPLCETVPGGHTTQSRNDQLPLKGLYVPGKQLKQFTAPTLGAYVPALQGEHDGEPIAFANVPFMHLMHWLAPEPEYVPRGQGEHEVDCLDEVKVPGEQSV